MVCVFKICVQLILLECFQVAYGSMGSGSACINGSYQTIGVGEGKPRVRPLKVTKPIYVDDLVVLTCNVTANPKAEISWLFEGSFTTLIGHQNEYRYSQCNETLTMRAAVPIDTGRYTCQAKNSYGEDSATAVVEVEQRDYSIFRKASIRREPSGCIQSGKNVSLSCGSNESKGICSWKKNNQSIDIESADEICDRRCCLLIRNFSKTDEGVYQCFMYFDVRKAEITLEIDDDCGLLETNASTTPTQRGNGTPQHTSSQTGLWLCTTGAFYLLIMSLCY